MGEIRAGGSCAACKARKMGMAEILGFETLAGAYYDGDTLDNIEGWIETMNHTPKCRGIMYTTWQNKYKLLPGFGDVVHRDAKPM